MNDVTGSNEPEFTEDDIAKSFAELTPEAFANAEPHRETLQEKRIRGLEERNTTLGREYASVSDALSRVLDLAKDYEEAGFQILGHQIREAIRTNPIKKAGE
jgi:hypothetical protein